MLRMSDDRPRVFGGVFDGTVGDFASDNIQALLPTTLDKLLPMSSLPSTAPSPGSDEHRRMIQTVEQQIYKSYVEADGRLLKLCADKGDHYAASTGVTAAVFADLNFMVLSWIGDSRIVIVRTGANGQPVGEYATQDHRPSDPDEKTRIEANGGSVENLQNHGGKPYIRGGDFMLRKALKEKPMQLQYSRAFGAKDLKIFGLTAEPHHHTCSTASVTHVVLASDGVWDMVNPEEAAILVASSQIKETGPETVLREVLLRHEAKGSQSKADNLTCMVLTL